MMKTTVLIGLFCGIVSSGGAQTTLSTYNWLQLAQSNQLRAGELVTADVRTALKIVNSNDTPQTVQVLEVLNPEITADHYAIVGEVKYEGVEPAGYLEMWSCFPGAKPRATEARYFSRTLADFGPMSKLTGSSDWRPFALPFDRTGMTNKPVRLQIDVVLPARGTVYLGVARLAEYPGGFEFGLPGMTRAWWPDRIGGVIGGIGGMIIGSLGSLTAWLASKGKARIFVVATLKLLIALGVVSFGVGITALILHQPYGVWFVFLLCGVILLAILPCRLSHYQKSYEAFEMRKMAALDA